MFHGLIPRFLRRLDRDGELKVMMSDKFDGVEVIGVGPIVHIHQRQLVVIDLLELERTGRLSPSADR